MLLLGVYNTITGNSPMLATWKKGQRGRWRGSTSAVITCWATRMCAGTLLNSSTSEYSALVNNYCTIIGRRGGGVITFSEGYVRLIIMLTLHTIIVILTCRGCYALAHNLCLSYLPERPYFSSISLNKNTSTVRWYKEHGIVPWQTKSGGQGLHGGHPPAGQLPH